MAEWTINLDASMHEAVDLATQQPARFEQHASLLHDLDGDDRVDRSPADIARLVAHLLKNTNAPFYGGYSLRPLVTRLRTHRVEVNEIIEQALRLGITDAGNILTASPAEPPVPIPLSACVGWLKSRVGRCGLFLVTVLVGVHRREPLDAAAPPGAGPSGASARGRPLTVRLTWQ